MDWIELTKESQLSEIKERSKDKLQVIFKHSSRCSISSMAKSRLERNTPPPNIDFHFLDLIRYRDVSNKIVEEFKVYHESPQILMIRNGECVYDESHSGISMAEIEEMVSSF
ncbi:MAG: bacillithiol system redox-active protein YtxJ [Ferruginibacter sp.]